MVDHWILISSIANMNAQSLVPKDIDFQEKKISRLTSSFVKRLLKNTSIGISTSHTLVQGEQCVFSHAIKYTKAEGPEQQLNEFRREALSPKIVEKWNPF